MKVYFDSRDQFYKKPFGAVTIGTEIVFRLRVTEPIRGLKCSISMWKDDERLPNLEMDKEKGDESGDVIYVAKYKTPKEPTIIWYHFVLENFDERYYYCNNDLQAGGVGKLVDSSPISFQQTIYRDDKTPNWFKEGIVYQIFPDRFNRGSDYEERKENTLKRIENKNHGKIFVDDWYKTPHYDRDEKGGVTGFEFYGGTLKGIEEKLPYLKSLGVTAIYLNPIFEARSNHRYDIGDYLKIDSLLGDEESFKSLVKAAKKEKIGIILDGVFSHQGADSVYFNKYNNYDSVGAYNSKDSKYFSWYNFTNFPNEYDCWWGVGELPNTKELNENYLDYICKKSDSVIKHWMKEGIIGFRLDVADELPDEFIAEIRKAMDKVNKDNILIGEVWEDATNKVSYDIHRKYYIDASLKSVTNYPFMDAAIGFMKGYIGPYELSEFFYKQIENYPMEYLKANINLLDSHDKVRIITELSDSRSVDEISDDEKYSHEIDRDKYLLAVSRLKALSVMQYTVMGVPLIYYGDEVGVFGYTDPYNRKTYPWGREDENLLAHYKVIGQMRANSNAIKEGDFRTLYCGNHTVAYERKYKNERVVVIINRGIFSEECEHIEIELGGSQAKSLIGDEVIDLVDGKLILDMESLGYKVLQIV